MPDTGPTNPYLRRLLGQQDKYITVPNDDMANIRANTTVPPAAQARPGEAWQNPNTNQYAKTLQKASGISADPTMKFTEEHPYLAQGADAMTNSSLFTDPYQEDKGPIDVALDHLPLLGKIYAGLKGAAGIGHAVSPYWDDIAKRKDLTNWYRGQALLMNNDATPHLYEAATGYPRVAANIHPQMTGSRASTSVPGRDTAGALYPPIGKVKPNQPMPLKITPEGLAVGPEDIRDTVYHEFTHGAEALGNKDLLQLYKDAEELAGYTFVPHEINANVAGGGARGLASSQTGPRVYTNKMLSIIADKYYNPNPQNMDDMYKNMLSRRIKKTLERRGVYTPMATMSGSADMVAHQANPKRYTPDQYMQYKFGHTDKKKLTPEQIEDLDGFRVRYNRRQKIDTFKP